VPAEAATRLCYVIRRSPSGCSAMPSRQRRVSPGSIRAMPGFCVNGPSPSVVISPTRLSTSTCLSANGISSKPLVSRLKKPIEALSNPPMAVNEATSTSFSPAKLVSPSIASSPG
jgi:hypothetical protein